jgi:Glycosyltransferase family 9 (heptosyltransferase)
MDHYLEFSGGLGDVFYQVYSEGAYRLLDRLNPDDRATVALICHNPYAWELFAWHPNASQIDVRDLGYWSPDEDPVRRALHRLPRRPHRLPPGHDQVRFYPRPADQPILSTGISDPYVVFAVSAGMPERSLPDAQVSALAAGVRKRGLLPVFVGRTYERQERTEYRPALSEGLDLIDRLSVPGVALVVQRAAGLVCCHSAVNILAWLMRRPQLLLYPMSVWERHIRRRDQWAFGIDFPECRHAYWEAARAEKKSEEFFAILEGRVEEAREGVRDNRP